LALAVYLASITLNVLKWQGLLRTLGVNVAYRSLFRHNPVGLFFASLPLNMIGGDIARGWDLARSKPEQSAQVAVSVLMDRLVGMAAFLTAAAAGLACAVVGLRRSELGWLLTTTAAILAGLVLVVCVMLSQRLRRLMERLFQPKPPRRFLPLYLRLSDSVQLYRTSARSVLAAYGLGLATIAGTCVVNYLGAMTVGADVPMATDHCCRLGRLSAAPWPRLGTPTPVSTREYTVAWPRCLQHVACRHSADRPDPAQRVHAPRTPDQRKPRKHGRIAGFLHQQHALPRGPNCGRHHALAGAAQPRQRLQSIPPPDEPGYDPPAGPTRWRSRRWLYACQLLAAGRNNA
jgi:hypothetical protein